MDIVGDEVLTNQTINDGLRAWVNAQRGREVRDQKLRRELGVPCCTELRTASKSSRPAVGYSADRHQDQRKATPSDLQSGLPEILGAHPR